jgi:hypothetical protein
MFEDPSNRNGNSRPENEVQRQPSDEELMSQVRLGDGDAFATLFDRHHRLVLKIALRILHEAAEAQEVTQNIFFELYRSAGRFDVRRPVTLTRHLRQDGRNWTLPRLCHWIR